MQEGWIKLHRSSIDNPLFSKPLVWHYFMYCLMRANHKTTKIVFNKKEIMIDRGCFITGREKASLETGLSPQNIRTAQATLINLGMIEKSTSKSTSKFTYLTICKYSEFQDLKTEGNQQTNHEPTSNQPATNQQLTTDKKENNNKKEKKKHSYSSEFELVWVEYRKYRDVGKQKAFKAWEARIKQNHSSELLTRCIGNYLRTCISNQTEEKYIKHLSSLIGTEKGFLDYKEGPLRTTKSKPQGSKPTSMMDKYLASQNEQPEIKEINPDGIAIEHNQEP